MSLNRTQNRITNYFKSKNSRSHSHEGNSRTDIINTSTTSNALHPNPITSTSTIQPSSTTHHSLHTLSTEKTNTRRRQRRSQPKGKRHTKLWTPHQTRLTAMGFSSNLNKPRSHLGQSWGDQERPKQACNFRIVSHNLGRIPVNGNDEKSRAIFQILGGRDGADIHLFQETGLHWNNLKSDNG